MPKETPAAQAKRADARIKRWRHNSFLGHCAMGQSHMQAIQQAETTTQRSRQLASEINTLLTELAASLKERKDG